MRRHKRLAVQVAWMLLIWSSSVIALLVAASIMRWLMRAIGMAA
jgi:hypothetical protein